MENAMQINSCEVCGNEALESVLDLGSHPLCDDLVPVGQSRECTLYPIEILYCSRCITAHQRFQVPKRELFPPSYHYRSRFTADVLSGMSSLVDATEQYLDDLKGRLVLDVGCNDASLLDIFKSRGAETIGIEPTQACQDGLSKGHALVNDFFNVETAREIRLKHGMPDVITFTNVFAHIENLPEVIDALKVLMSPTTTLVVENHYLGAVLDRYQFDTFYHEHPRTYSLTSFCQIAHTLGAMVTQVEFPARYGGNIRVFIGGAKRCAGERLPAIDSILDVEKRFSVRLNKLQAQVEHWRFGKSRILHELAALHGPLCAKAFPGRAAILVKLLSIDNEIVQAVYEKPGSMKIGHYLPGTRIPILSDDEFFSRAIKPPILLNLAWHISDEIRGYLENHDYSGKVIDIMAPMEFTG